MIAAMKKRFAHLLPILASPLLILLVGTAVRLYRLDSQSMWFDEAARLLMARLEVSDILENVGGDTLPPFYHLTMHYWGELGTTDFWLRLPPVLAGVLAIAVIYRLGMDLFGRRTAVLAGWFFVFMPYQVFQAQQASMYSYLVLFSAVQMLCFWRGINRKQGWDISGNPEKATRNQSTTQPRYYSQKLAWIGFVLSVVIGLYTHYFTAFLLIALHLFWLMGGRQKWQASWRWLVSADLLAALLFLPQLASFVRGAGDVSGSFWLTRPTILQPLMTFYLFVVGYALDGWLVAFALFLLLAFLAVALFELFYQRKALRTVMQPLLFITVLTITPITLVWIISQWVPVYLDRVLIVVTPAFTIGLAWLFQRARWSSITPYLGLLLMGVALVSLSNYYFDEGYAKPDYRSAVELIQQNRQPDDLLLHTANGSYIPFLLYMPAQDHLILPGDPAPHHPPGLFTAVGGRELNEVDLLAHRRVWLIVALEHSVAWQTEQANLFAESYPLLEHHTVSGIELYLYDLTAR